MHIKLFGKEVVPTDSGETFPDPDDKMFFCTALAGASNLVTGNMKHYPKADFIVTRAVLRTRRNLNLAIGILLTSVRK